MINNNKNIVKEQIEKSGGDSVYFSGLIARLNSALGSNFNAGNFTVDEDTLIQIGTTAKQAILKNPAMEEVVRNLLDRVMELNVLSNSREKACIDKGEVIAQQILANPKNVNVLYQFQKNWGEERIQPKDFDSDEAQGIYQKRYQLLSCLERDIIPCFMDSFQVKDIKLVFDDTMTSKASFDTKDNTMAISISKRNLLYNYSFSGLITTISHELHHVNQTTLIYDRTNPELDTILPSGIGDEYLKMAAEFYTQDDDNNIESYQNNPIEQEAVLVADSCCRALNRGIKLAKQSSFLQNQNAVARKVQEQGRQRALHNRT